MPPAPDLGLQLPREADQLIDDGFDAAWLERWLAVTNVIYAICVLEIDVPPDVLARVFSPTDGE